MIIFVIILTFLMIFPQITKFVNIVGICEQHIGNGTIVGNRIIDTCNAANIAVNGVLSKVVIFLACLTLLSGIIISFKYKIKKYIYIYKVRVENINKLTAALLSENSKKNKIYIENKRIKVNVSNIDVQHNGTEVYLKIYYH